MKSFYSVIGLAAIVCLSLVACDELYSPSEPTRHAIVSIDHTCSQSPANVLVCQAIVNGGDDPLQYNWQASFTGSQSVTGNPNVSFDYTNFCLGKFQTVPVTVTLNVRDARGEEQGPVSKIYTICNQGAF